METPLPPLALSATCRRCTALPLAPHGVFRSARARGPRSWDQRDWQQPQRMSSKRRPATTEKPSPWKMAQVPLQHRHRSGDNPSSGMLESFSKPSDLAFQVCRSTVIPPRAVETTSLPSGTPPATSTRDASTVRTHQLSFITEDKEEFHGTARLASLVVWLLLSSAGLPACIILFRCDTCLSDDTSSFRPFKAPLIPPL